MSASGEPRHNASASSSDCAALSASPRESAPRPSSEQAAEPVGVDLGVDELEDVATGPRVEALAGAERLAQSRDVSLERLTCRGRWPGAVEIVDQAVDGDDVAAVEKEDCEQRALTRAAEIHCTAVVFDLQWAKDPEVHVVRRNRL